MLPTIRANLLAAGLRAVEKAEQTRDGEEVPALERPVGRARERHSQPGVTYSPTADGSRITLSQPEAQNLGGLLDCRV